MIRGYNFPSGSEKVTIDDSKVTEKMNLYSFQNQVVLEVDAPINNIPSTYAYQGKLYDGSKLYMKTTLTIVRDGSPYSSEGCTGTVLLIKPDRTQLSIDIPSYKIPDERSETGRSPISYTYSCKLYFSPDGNIYLILQREFYDSRSSSSHTTYYWSIYKLYIHSSSLEWKQYAFEITLGRGVRFYKNDFIIDNNYMYASGGDGSNRYIYGYRFGDTTSYTFQKISTNGIEDTGNDTTIFAKKGTNTYIYFLTNSAEVLVNRWISVTRNSDETYSEASGTAWLSKEHKQYKMFMLKDEIYIQTLGYGGYSGYEGFHIYRLNSYNSGWDPVYEIKNATSYNTKITSYLNNAPDTIFQGSEATTVRSDGTFDFIKFLPGTVEYSEITTPKISIGSQEEWYYYDYKYNDIGQNIFFFKVKIDTYYYSAVQYKCILEAEDGSPPILYSTFRENDIKIII